MSDPFFIIFIVYYQSDKLCNAFACCQADTCECYLAMKSDAEKLVPEDETCRDVTVLARLTEKMKDYVEKELSLVAHVYKKVVSLDYQDIVHRQLGDLVSILSFKNLCKNDYYCPLRERSWEWVMSAFINFHNSSRFVSYYFLCITECPKWHLVTWVAYVFSLWRGLSWNV